MRSAILNMEKTIDELNDLNRTLSEELEQSRIETSNLKEKAANDVFRHA